MPKKSKSLDPQETLERFVIRARRVESHSLVKDGRARKYANPTTRVTISEDGSVSKHDNVLEDEELLESLAARLRPFIVPGEPLYFDKVILAIRASIQPDELSDKVDEALNGFSAWFEHRVRERISLKFTIQQLDEDESPVTKPLSDELLAESWIYTDLVHADPKGEKAEGAKLDYLDRYTSASSFFCELAIAVVGLLRFVRKLADEKKLHVDERCWDEPVTYAEAVERRGENVVMEQVYIAPVGTIPPSGGDLEQSGFKRLTFMEMCLTANPEGSAILAVLTQDEKCVQRYRAYKALSADQLIFIVADCLKVSVSSNVLTESQGGSSTCDVRPLIGKEKEARELLSKIAAPNFGVIAFNYEGTIKTAFLNVPDGFRFAAAEEGVEKDASS